MSHELSFKQWHHGYLGLLIILSGVLETKHHRAAGLVLVVVGSLVLLDDLVQHTVQAITKTEWSSPLHRLYGWVYSKLPAIRTLNRWLDGLFS